MIDVNCKVFGIGLNKTGTSSLGRSFQYLGLNHLGCRPDLLRKYLMGKKTEVFAELEEFESFEDWPYPIMYQDLFHHFDNSKFILTTRISPEIWLKSLKNHALFTKPFRNCRKLVYGEQYPHYDELYFIDIYSRFNNRVIRFFEDQNASDRLLLVCWEDGSTIKHIADFLHIDGEYAEAPHENSTQEREASGFEFLNNLCIRTKGVFHTEKTKYNGALPL